MNATIIPERLAALNTLHLDYGSHRSYDEGACAMEVVAWLAGEGITDAPACASGVLRTFTVELNDRWLDKQRQKLRPFLPRMVGTANDGQDEARSYLALDWLIRTFTPAWLDLAGLSDAADELRALRRIADLAAAKAADPVVRASRDAATVAREAARDAALAAARTPAWDAARVAAWEAAWKAAWNAAWHTAARATGETAREAAREAAGEATWEAAWEAARVAAWEATGVAAWNTALAAARAAAWEATGVAARNAAVAAVRDSLQLTVETLQQSTLDLLDRMINPAGVAS